MHQISFPVEELFNFPLINCQQIRYFQLIIKLLAQTDYLQALLYIIFYCLSDITLLKYILYFLEQQQLILNNIIITTIKAINNCNFHGTIIWYMKQKDR